MKADLWRPVPLLGVFATCCLVLACATAPAPSDPTQTQAAEPQAEEDPALGATLGSEGGATAAPRDPKTAHLKVFALSDFHGWLLPLEPKSSAKYYGGIANFVGLLEHAEKIDRQSSIILDNGDMWTGPTESTLLRGESVIQAYNQLGLAAANVANHEFDFGIEVLKARAQEAKFPFLGANIVNSGASEHPSFLKPWIVIERDGIKVGIIGLSYYGTPKTTLAKHVAGLEFKPYRETLERVVPEARAAGAQVVVVLFHDTIEVISAVLSEMKDSGVHLVVAGQNHRKGERVVAGIPVVNPGPFGRSYVRFEVDVDRASGKVEKVSHQIVDITGDVGNPPHPPSGPLLAIAEAARQKAKALSSEVLGKISGPLQVGSFADSPIGHLFVDAWLNAWPDADLAICNHGAFRQPLAQGPVTIGDLTAVMPFENSLYIVKLSGKQLKEQLSIDDPVVAGITWKYREKDKVRQVVSVSDRVGQSIGDKKTYKVLINDFMYFGGDGYGFKDLDSAPTDSGLSILEPIMRLFRRAETGGKSVDPPVGARAARLGK